MSFFIRPLIIGLFVVIANTAHAIELSPELQGLIKGLGLSEKHVSKTPLDGVYELQAGSKIYYISSDAKYLLTGDLVNMQTKENLTEKRLKGVRVDLLTRIEDNQLLHFNAEKPLHRIKVFTDIDCGYCRKLHSEMAQYNDLGISVDYLFYPRTGLGTPSYNSAVSVWCNKDRNDAMTRAKSGEDLPIEKCENPVVKHYLLGNEMGINGTPAIVTEDGTLMPGYLPPDAMRKQLDALKASTSDNKVSAR